MSRDPLARMDVDTRWAYHRKCRALQASHPTDWPSHWCAYLAVLGESWAAGDRVALRDAWVPSLPVAIDATLAALFDAGLLDKSGRVPLKSWDEWFGPALARIESLKARGRKGAETRWRKHEKGTSSHRPSDGTAMAEPSVSNGQRMHHASQPTTPATPANHATDERATGEPDEPYRTLEELTGDFPVQRVEPNAIRTLDALCDRRGIPAVLEALRAEAPGIETQPPGPWQLIAAARNRLEPFSNGKPKPEVIGKGGVSGEDAERAFGIVR